MGPSMTRLSQSPLTHLRRAALALLCVGLVGCGTQMTPPPAKVTTQVLPRLQLQGLPELALRSQAQVQLHEVAFHAPQVSLAFDDDNLPLNNDGALVFRANADTHMRGTAGLQSWDLNAARGHADAAFAFRFSPATADSLAGRGLHTTLRDAFDGNSAVMTGVFVPAAPSGDRFSAGDADGSPADEELHSDTFAGDADGSPADEVSAGDADGSPADELASGDADGSPADEVASGDADGSPADEEASGDADGSPADEEASGDADGSPADEEASGDADGSPADEAASGDADGSPADEEASGDADGSPADEEASGDADGSPADEKASGDADGSPAAGDADGSPAEGSDESDPMFNSSSELSDHPSEHLPGGNGLFDCGDVAEGALRFVLVVSSEVDLSTPAASALQAAPDEVVPVDLNVDLDALFSDELMDQLSRWADNHKDERIVVVEVSPQTARAALRVQVKPVMPNANRPVLTDVRRR